MKLRSLIIGLMVLYSIPHAETIHFKNAEEAITVRNALKQYIWGNAGMPNIRVPDSVFININDPYYSAIQSPAGALSRIDLYLVDMGYGLKSYVYHFHSAVPNGKLFIYHSGHSPGGFKEEDTYINGFVPPGKVIPLLLSSGYDVLAFSMPLYGNTNPELETSDGHIEKYVYHGQIFTYLPHPYTYFFDPLVICLNYIEDNYAYSRISMTGLSGGGWTTTLYQALDPRIDEGFAVAGSEPLDLREGYEGLGDSEQGYDYNGLYGIANYQEIYCLASFGPDRHHVQILNRYDDQTFWGQRHVFWVDSVKNTVSSLGSGDYEFYLDETVHQHIISDYALSIILDTQRESKPEVPRSISPSNEEEITAKKVYFDWTQSIRSEIFEFQVATDSAFAETVFESSDIKSSISEYSIDLIFPNTYYWRVAATNSYGRSDWSSIRRFSISNNPPMVCSSLHDSISDGVNYKYDVVTADPDTNSFGDTVNVRVISKPWWVVFDGDHRSLTGEVPIGAKDTVIILEAYDNRGGIKRDSVQLEIFHVNHDPDIFSTPSTVAYEDSSYIYKIVAHDIDSEIFHDVLTYYLLVSPRWLAIDSVKGIITGTPSATNVSDTTVIVVVSDNQGGSFSQSIDLHVTHTNHLPYAVLYPDTDAYEDSSYHSRIIGYDLDTERFGDMLDYRLSVAPSWLEIDTTTGTVHGIPRLANLADTLFRGKISDNVGGEAEFEFKIHIHHRNHPPELTWIGLQSAFEDVVFSGKVTATDKDTIVGDILNYSFYSKPDWLSIDSVNGVMSGMPQSRDVGDKSCTLVVSDGKGGIVTKAFDVKISHTNHPPEISAFTSVTASEDTLFTTKVHAFDRDSALFGDMIRYHALRHPAWISMDTTSGTISGTPHIEDLADTSMTVRACDNAGGADTLAFSIHIHHTNHAPQIAAIGTLDALEDNTFVFKIPATDIDTLVGDRLRFRLTTAPSWLRLDSLSGMLSGTPSAEHVGDTTCMIRVDDGQGGTAVRQVNVNIRHTNHPPVLLTSALPDGVEDSLYTLSLSAMDQDAERFGDRVFYQVMNAEWLTVDKETGLLQGTPKAPEVGTRLILFKVFDSHNAYDIHAIGLCVAHTNHTPVVLSEPVKTAAEDSVYRYHIRATDQDSSFGDRLKVYPGTVPSWMEFDSLAGVLYGVPGSTHVGDTTASILISDGNGGLSEQRFNIHVAHTNHHPSITTVSLNTAIEDSAYRMNIMASDPDASLFGDRITYHLSGADWLMIDSLSGVITGLPKAADLSGSNVMITVEDDKGGATNRTYPLHVTHTNHPPLFASVPDTIAYEDSSYIYHPILSDPDAKRFNDHVADSLIAAPQFLRDASRPGVVTGMPVITFFSDNHANLRTGPAGMYADTAVTILGFDDKGGSAVQTFTLRVIHRNHAPTILSHPDTIAIEDSLYRYQIGVTDVDRTVFHDSLTVAFTAKPSWLNFDPVLRTLTGIPSGINARDTVVSINVTDGNGGADRQSYRLSITPVNHAPVVTSTPSLMAYEDSLYRYPLTISDADNDFKRDSVTVRILTGPSWLSLNAATSVLYGRPQCINIGDTLVSVEARDRSNASAIQSWKLIVNAVRYAPLPPRLLSPKKIDTLAIPADSAAIHFTWVSAKDRNLRDTLYYRVRCWKDEFDTSSGWLRDTSWSIYWEQPDGANLGVLWTVSVTDGYFYVAAKDTFKILFKSSTGVREWGASVPKDYVVYQNYPNPFNPSTVIRFGVPERSRVSLDIYNSIGQLVQTIYRGVDLEPRFYEITWNAADKANGMYIAVLRAESLSRYPRHFRSIKKLLLVK